MTHARIRFDGDIDQVCVMILFSNILHFDTCREFAKVLAWSWFISIKQSDLIFFKFFSLSAIVLMRHLLRCVVDYVIITVIALNTYNCNLDYVISFTYIQCYSSCQARSNGLYTINYCCETICLYYTSLCNIYGRINLSFVRAHRRCHVNKQCRITGRRISGKLDSKYKGSCAMTRYAAAIFSPSER